MNTSPGSESGEELGEIMMTSSGWLRHLFSYKVQQNITWCQA